MNREQQLNFELYVMDLAEDCMTATDFENLSNELHESIENALQDMCMDNNITDYSPSY